VTLCDVTDRFSGVATGGQCNEHTLSALGDQKLSAVVFPIKDQMYISIKYNIHKTAVG